MTINSFLKEFDQPTIERNLEKKFTMLVKNFDDTKWGKKHAPYPCITMEKLDGVCALAVNIHGVVRLFSRTGKRLQNTGYLEVLLEKSMPVVNQVVCVEVCCDGLSLEQISGITNPNRTEALEEDLEEFWLHNVWLGAYDIVTLSQFIEGRSDETFHARLCWLRRLRAEGMFVEIPYHEITNSEEESLEIFNDIVSEGGEGIVQCLIEYPWIAGYKNQAKTKRVRGVDYDLKVIGVQEGKGKRAGMVGNLVVLWRKYGDANNAPEPLPVDGRFTDEQRIYMLLKPETVIGKIAHVHALQMGSKGSLRLPKVRVIRTDKFESDL